MGSIMEKEVKGGMQAVSERARGGYAAYGFTDHGYTRWRDGGRIPRKSVDTMCCIGIFIFGWLLASAYSSAGRGKQGWAIIGGVIFLNVIGPSIGGLLPLAGIALYIGAWIYLRTKVGGYEKRLHSESTRNLSEGRKAVEDRPEDPKGHFQMAQALKDMDRKEEALAALQRGIALDPNDAAKQNELGTMLMGANRFDEALQHLQEAVRYASLEDKNIPVYYRNQARALKKLGRGTEAKEAKSMAKVARKRL